jgi:hypothetical protein
MNNSMDSAMDKLDSHERKNTGKFSVAEWMLLATAGLAFSAVVGIVGYSALIV